MVTKKQREAYIYGRGDIVIRFPMSYFNLYVEYKSIRISGRSAGLGSYNEHQKDNYEDTLGHKYRLGKYYVTRNNKFKARSCGTYGKNITDESGKIWPTNYTKNEDSGLISDTIIL